MSARDPLVLALGKYMTVFSIFCECWGTELGSPCFYGKHFTRPHHLPNLSSPIFIYLFFIFNSASYSSSFILLEHLFSLISLIQLPTQKTCGHLSFHAPKTDPVLPCQSPFLKTVYNKIIHLTAKTRYLFCLVILVLHI